MRVALKDGAYKARSLIAGAQRSVNLYAEKDLGQPPTALTYYPRAGLVNPPLATAIFSGWRCLYMASNGTLYGCVSQTVYAIHPDFTLTPLGTINTSSGIVSMADNTLVMIIVDGTLNTGWYVDLSDNSFGTIGSQAGAFYGANLVDYIDTFFIFNRPNTNQWFISISEIDANTLVSGPIATGSVTGGSGYSNGTHLSVPLSGGSGTGATADIVVAGGIVTTVTLDTAGQNFKPGDTLSASALALGSGVTAGSITTGGTKYVNGSYTGIPLTGGTGSGVKASITVAAGIVTVVTITTPGIGYTVGDVLSVAQASLGGTGGGLTYTVTTVNNTGSGFIYTVNTIGSSAFDLLDIASKTGAQDLLTGLIALRDEIWLLGKQTSEVWYNSGAADFTFQRIPQALIEHGCCAVHSIAKADVATFWLSLDKQGQGLAFMGSNYAAQRISQNAIENEWLTYPTISDAIGYTYQIEGHVFYVLIFPTADKTWVYDMATGEWHEETWTDTDGGEHRIRANCHAFAYGKHIVGDWQNGNLYELSTTAYDDAGTEIVFRRGFPHLINDGRRVIYQRFVADVDVGTPKTPPELTTDAPQISMRMSHTKGASWGNPVSQSVGSEGQYDTQVQYRQCGLGRDVVFELFWSYNSLSALNGAFVDVLPCKT